MRRFDHEKFKEWLDENGAGSLGQLSAETGLSVHTLLRYKGGGYKSTPTPVTRKLLCEGTGLDQDTLFPKVESVDAS